MLKAQTGSVSSARRNPRARIHMSVNRFAAWQRQTPSSTPILTRLIRLLAR
jgi:hypothetical protein